MKGGKKATKTPVSCAQACHLQEEAQLQPPIVLEVRVHMQALVHALHIGKRASLPHRVCRFASSLITLRQLYTALHAGTT